MIRGRNIVCVASNWFDHPTSKHHVMRALAEHNDVLLDTALAYLKLGEIKKAEKNLDKAKHYAWDDENKAYYDRLREKLFKRVSN